MKGRCILKKSNQSLFNTYFDHIYIENKAMNHPNTKKILNHFKNSEIIEINCYKELFSRSNQDFILQKQTPKIILAVKTENLVYKGSNMCDSFGNNHFYYTSTMMNCIYDCEYCYLQGMYPSANIVIFVNIEDIFAEVEKLLNIHDVYLCISYDTDILAFENILDYGQKWLNFVKKHDNLKLELRTKSANFESISDITPCSRVVLAWTLSPETVINNYEHRTPKLEARLKSAKQAIEAGWNIRICFDPILYLKDWQNNYKDLISKTFTILPSGKIKDISIGVFRISTDYYKIMRKKRFDSIILNYPFESVNKICSYSNNLAKQMVSFVYDLVKQYVPENKIYI